MALFRRQAAKPNIYDDQHPDLWGLFEGNWYRYHNMTEYHNGTSTATSTTGASLTFTFTGSQAWLYGTRANSSTNPAAHYQVDGCSVGPQEPTLDNNVKQYLYFQTGLLEDGTHMIEIVVTVANETNTFALDYLLITGHLTPNTGWVPSSVGTSHTVPSSTSSVGTSGSAPSSTSSFDIPGGIPPPTSSIVASSTAPSSTSTSSGIPIATTKSTPIGAIVGGAVGGIIGITTLALALLWYFLRRRSRGGQAYYFEKPTPADILAGEVLLGHVDPFDVTATTPGPSSALFSGLGSRPTDPGSPSSLSFRRAAASPSPSRHNRLGSSETVLTHVSGGPPQPRVGKAALIALDNQDIQQPAQSQDSGIRFNEIGEQEAGPSQSPKEVPPTYTPD